MDTSQLFTIAAVLLIVLVFLAVGSVLIFWGIKRFRSGSDKNTFTNFQTFGKMPEDAQKVFDSFPDAQKIFDQFPNIFNTASNNQPNYGAQDPKPYENAKNTSDEQQEQEERIMNKWEYLTIQLMPVKKQWDANYFSQQVNSYGEQGWELVSVFTTEGVGVATMMSLVGGVTNGVFAMFKRLKA